jgi:NMD protein affecting ribosome stability and mRNA decay
MHVVATLASRKDLRHIFFLGMEMNAHIIVGHAKDRQVFITSFDKKKNGKDYKLSSTTTKDNLVCQHASFLPQKPRP